MQKVLIVDDDAITRQMLIDFIENYDLEAEGRNWRFFGDKTAIGLIF